MKDFNELLEISPYSLDKQEKRKFLNDRLLSLTKHHAKHCEYYQKMLRCLGKDAEEIQEYDDIPFLPVRLFKELDLLSVPKEEVFKTMTSSGTTGQAVSKIYLNRDTANYQQKTLVKIVSEFTGSNRLPMLIIDCPSVVKNRLMFSARGAGILGFSMFGTDKTYVLDDDMNINVSALEEFLVKHAGEKILLFGFTFMIWQHFYKALKELKETEGKTFDLSQGVLIHGGGWKKLVSEAVSAEAFRDALTEVCGLYDVHDYYGMVEQTGCVYMQCEEGHLHTSIFSDIIMRDENTLQPCAPGEKGVIQVVSTLPESYPGHSLLTEDEGILLGEDDCPCGRKGKYFKIIGRLKNAEIRGCSDTYAQKF